MRVTPAAIAALLLPALGVAQAPGSGPSFEDVLSLRSVGAVALSPDGHTVAFTIRSTNWKDNRYDTEIWLAREGAAPFQLTRTPSGSSRAPRWSPDGHWIAFLADRGEKQQIYLIRADGGEARRVTDTKEGVDDFRWAPEGRRIAYTAKESEPDSIKQRQSKYGDFSIEGSDFRQTALWLLDVPAESLATAPVCPSQPDSATASVAMTHCTPAARPKRLTGGERFTVQAFAWSPDGTRIAFEHQINPLLGSDVTADISVLTLASGVVRPLVTTPGPDGSPVWSPDGKWVLYATAGGDTTSYYYKNGQLAKIPADGGMPVRLAADLDEDLSDAEWTPAGIYLLAWQGTKRALFEVDPAGGRTRAVGGAPDDIYSVTFSADGRTVALLGQTPTTLTEVYRTTLAPFRPVAVTTMSRQIAAWPVGTSEIISWTSQDGTRIEGVLSKPRDFTPTRRYPLLVVIHGGPTGIDVPTPPVSGYVYPIPQWLAKGALVLRPNYRGSAGYGEKFRSLNVRNLGVGDAWDVLSGVDHLIHLGFVDTTRLGAMGWSQGGYISAYLTTTTSRFKAISVGAGISDWMTYYVNTDIHPFTREYLRATPWDDPAIYAKTSPITFIKQARTPTLIQHGEFDRRVPIPNGYELYQGLQDVGVETRMIVYKGFGHGINKPKEQLAAMWHNWQWFAQHLWGEALVLPLARRDSTK